MAARLTGFVVATAVLGAGCGFFMEPKPDLENKKTARVGNLSVEHAGNWKTELETDAAEGMTFSSLTVESHGERARIRAGVRAGHRFQSGAGVRHLRRRHARG